MKTEGDYPLFPQEKAVTTKTSLAELEKKLWSANDQLRSSFKWKIYEYSDLRLLSKG